MGKGTSVLGTILDMQVFSLIPLNRHLCSEEASRAKTTGKQTGVRKVSTDPSGFSPWQVLAVMDFFVRQKVKPLLDLGEGFVVTTLTGVAEPIRQLINAVTPLNIPSASQQYAAMSDSSNKAQQLGIVLGDLAVAGVGIVEGAMGFATALVGVAGLTGGSAALGPLIALTGPGGAAAAAVVASSGAAVAAAGLAASAAGVITAGTAIAKLEGDWNALLSSGDNSSSGGSESQRKENPTKGESKIWKDLENVKGKDRKASGSGNNKKYYEWDHTHNDIEVYDKNGKHLGSMDPTTGEMYKPPVSGRTIKP